MVSEGVLDCWLEKRSNLKVSLSALEILYFIFFMDRMIHLENNLQINQ